MESPAVNSPVFTHTAQTEKSWDTIKMEFSGWIQHEHKRLYSWKYSYLFHYLAFKFADVSFQVIWQNSERGIFKPSYLNTNNE